MLKDHRSQRDKFPNEQSPGETVSDRINNGVVAVAQEVQNHLGILTDKHVIEKKEGMGQKG